MCANRKYSCFCTLFLVLEVRLLSQDAAEAGRIEELKEEDEETDEKSVEEEDDDEKVRKLVFDFFHVQSQIGFSVVCRCGGRGQRRGDG